MAWLRIQKWIEAALLLDTADRMPRRTRAAVAHLIGSSDLDAWLDPTLPSWVVVSPTPTLAGAASVFNLAGTMDEPVVGLMQPGATPDEAVELLPFYVDQAERILGQAERLMQSSERVLKDRVRRDFSRKPTFPVTLMPPREANRSETDQEKTRKNSKRFP